ncbi:MAG TPA: DUF2272 domain-containing protein [Ideonella sp.]|uniref:DUF2272 domain-containing protein n=1 Tax=Ideonella sp. TaxID=1929293 RepID=UPI002E361066|nr:DUF2272 domain-containing protein [Ideonella sp.]HEX5687487.1 DUF2272 domain-containing protein [Ideonella sp.]
MSDAQVASLIHSAETEWVRWGAMRAYGLPGNELCLVISDGSCQDVQDGCGQEQTTALCPLVDEYWAQVRYAFGHDCTRNDVCEWQWPGPDEPVTTSAWSAAFISAVMARAGISQTEFRRDHRHAVYIAAARDGQASAYEVVPTPAMAAPGDLICAGRKSGSGWPSHITPATIAHVMAGVGMHCDLVVSMDPTHNTLDAIGGNVKQTVARTTVDLDEMGRVSFDLDRGRKWVLVMRARRASPQLVDR